MTKQELQDLSKRTDHIGWSNGLKPDGKGYAYGSMPGGLIYHHKDAIVSFTKGICRGGGTQILYAPTLQQIASN